MRSVREQIDEFLADPSKKKVVINVPRGFRMPDVVNPFVLAYRRFVLFWQKWFIPSRFKNWLLRTTGLNIGNEVCIPHYIHFDPYFPELITIDEGSIVGGLSTIHSHTLENRKLTLGRVHVKERVLVAGFSTLYPGVTMHKNSIIGMFTQARKDIPKGSFVVGKDKLIKKWSKEELKRHFGKEKPKKDYRTRLKQATKQFREDASQRRLVVRYEGTRFNPGNEWYLARPMFRIYYNAIFVELARLAPTSTIRKFLLRAMGASIGKNVYIGKGVIFDHIYGDLVTIDDGAHIGAGCYMDGHSYTINETIFGRVDIGKNVRLEDNVNVFPGVVIGDNAVVKGPASVIKDIPAKETWAGIPAKKVE